MSEEASSFCSGKIAGPSPKTTRNAAELCESDEVDAVMVCSGPAAHAEHVVMALKNNKHVFVEKPLTVCFRDVDAMEAAENMSNGSVFVGFNRRFAPSFLDALEELQHAGPVQYARVRDIIAPNEHFIQQSGFAHRKFADIPPAEADKLSSSDQQMYDIALREEYAVPVTDETKFMLFALSALGSHDFSTMREALGMPRSVRGAVLKPPIWTAIFEYDSFAVVYESGINGAPLFDCHIEIYTESKILRVNYDSPFIKGLPITMTVREKISGPRGEDYYQQREVRSTYEDTYTLEHKDWYNCIVNGVKPKCGLADAREDLEIYRMLLRAGFGASEK